MQRSEVNYLPHGRFTWSRTPVGKVRSLYCGHNTPAAVDAARVSLAHFPLAISLRENQKAVLQAAGLNASLHAAKKSKGCMYAVTKTKPHACELLTPRFDDD